MGPILGLLPAPFLGFLDLGLHSGLLLSLPAGGLLLGQPPGFGSLQGLASFAFDGGGAKRVQQPQAVADLSVCRFLKLLHAIGGIDAMQPGDHHGDVIAAGPLLGSLLDRGRDHLQRGLMIGHPLLLPLGDLIQRLLVGLDQVQDLGLKRLGLGIHGTPIFQGVALGLLPCRLDAAADLPQAGDVAAG